MSLYLQNLIKIYVIGPWIHLKIEIGLNYSLMTSFDYSTVITVTHFQGAVFSKPHVRSVMEVSGETGRQAVC